MNKHHECAIPNLIDSSRRSLRESIMLGIAHEWCLFIQGNFRVVAMATINMKKGGLNMLTFLKHDTIYFEAE